MVRPMENTTEMQAMVNGDGDTANNESQVKGQLISKDTFNCGNSFRNERKHLYKIDLERLVPCPSTMICACSNFLSQIENEIVLHMCHSKRFCAGTTIEFIV